MKFPKLSNRFLFLTTLLAVLVGVSSYFVFNTYYNPEFFLAQVSGKKINETRGVWLTVTDSDVLKDASKMRDVVADLKSKGVNAIYPNVWGRGLMFHGGQVQSPIFKDVNFSPDPKEFKGDFMFELSRATMFDKDIQLVPWFEYGLKIDLNSPLAKKFPNWLMKKSDGTNSFKVKEFELGYLNPLIPEVKLLFKEMIADMYVNYSIDGMAFDDQLSWPQEYSYDDLTKKTYLKETGRNVPSYGTEPNFLAWKATKLTQFIKEAIVDGMKEALTKTRRPDVAEKGISDPKAPYGKRPFLAISQNKFPYSYNQFSQDWPDWLNKGYFDEFTVQLYHTDTASFVSNVDDQLRYLNKYKSKFPINIAVLSGVGTKITPFPVFISQLKALRTRGLGFGIYYYQTLMNQLKNTENAKSFASFTSVPAQPTIRKL
jgi:uncharacterized lipoprotein YddW (UPF0748 family)